MSILGVRAAVALTLLAFVAVAGADPVPITTCHQVIARGSGELTADLDCSGNPLAIGVEVRNGGKLYLNGHSITGAEIGVACSERCKIYGPGTISGNSEGVDQFSGRANGGKVSVQDAGITSNSVIAIGGDRVQVVRSTITGNGGTAHGGVIASRRVTVRDSTITGNATYGVCSPERITVANSTLEGNGTAPGCTPDQVCGACGDIVSSKRPGVSQSSTCDVSADPPSGTWGVCSND